MQARNLARSLTRAAAVAAISLMLGACDETLTTPTPDDLSGAWRLTSIEPRNAPALRPRLEVPMGIEFGGNRITIRSDCNSCSGTFSASGGAFRLSQVICTLRACTSESLEGPYLQLLTTADTISVVPGQVLTLQGPNGSLAFSR